MVGSCICQGHLVMPQTLVAPTPKIALIMWSIEAIIETLKGPLIESVKGEKTQSTRGNPDNSRGLECGHPMSTSLGKYKWSSF